MVLTVVMIFKLCGQVWVAGVSPSHGHRGLQPGHAQQTQEEANGWLVGSISSVGADIAAML